MKRRLVLGGMTSAVVLALALGLLQRTSRPAPTPQDVIEAQRKEDLKKTIAAHPEIKRPMASYRVHEEQKGDIVTHRGGGYTSETSPKGLHYEAAGSFLDLRATRLEQGDKSIICADGTLTNPAFGDVRIDRGCLVEQYIFENTRTEQIFRIPRPVGIGALRVMVAVTTGFDGPVFQSRRSQSGWKDLTLSDGGIAFSDTKGTKKIAYHGAVAIDAEGRRVDLDPVYSGGQIALEVPADFMATASYPVAVDPWLELNFSASGGGISNSAAVSQTPNVVVVGGGNPWVTWSENVTNNGVSNFEIFFRYWNGFLWTDLGGSSTAGGISNNAGDSINPTVTQGDIGPYVAWQDDTSGTSQIYLKHWNGSAWEELSSTTPFSGNPTTTSATAGGVSLGIGTFNSHPSISQMFVTIPSTGALKTVPVLAYESTNPGPNSIICAAYFPGDPGQQETFDPLTGVPVLLNFPVIPQGWYALGGNGAASQYPILQMSNTPAGFVSQHPSLAVPTQGSHAATIAWHDTRHGTHDIMVAQYAEAGFAGGDHAPNFPASRPPNFAFGTWNGLGTSFAVGGITNNAPGNVNFSINPSLSMEGPSINPTVAWEQVFTLTDSDIFLLQWTGAAWVGPATGGAAPDNVSNTPGTISANPSVVVDGGVPFVAWQDDASGNSEIYVRRLGVGAWNEVGFNSNSASVGPSAGIGGISQTTGGSLTPSIAASGGATVAWQDFAGGNYEIYVRRFYENEPLFLRQTQVGGAPVVPFGAPTGATIIELRATAFSESTARLVRMQVEVVPVGSQFVGNITQESGEVTIDPVTHLGTAEMFVPFKGLVNVAYQWRARTVDDLGQTSAWISAGSSDGITDFTVTAVQMVAPGTPANLIVSLINGIVTLSWTAPPGGADSYNVKRSNVAGGGGYPPATIISASGAVTTTAFPDPSTTPGSTYFYVVSAVRAGLESATNSNEVTITVPIGFGGVGGSPDQVNKKRCALMGGDALLVLALVSFWRRRRR